MRDSILKVLMVIVLMTSFTLPTFAQETTTQTRQEKVAQRCELITQRISVITTKYDTNKQRHIQRYERIAEKVTELVKKLEAKDIDVAKLKQYLSQIVELKKEFVSEYTQFIDSLKQAQTYVCGNSEGDFKLKVQEAKSHLLKAREASLEIRVIINDQLKPELKSIITQIRNK